MKRNGVQKASARGQRDKTSVKVINPTNPESVYFNKSQPQAGSSRGPGTLYGAQSEDSPRSTLRQNRVHEMTMAMNAVVTSATKATELINRVLRENEVDTSGADGL